MSDEYLGASLDGIVESRVPGGVLDFRVDVHLDTHEEYNGLHVLLQDGQVKKVLPFAVHLHTCTCTCMYMLNVNYVCT